MNSSNKNNTDAISPEKDIPGLQKDKFVEDVSLQKNARDLESYLDFLEEIEAFRKKKVETSFVGTRFTL